MNTRIKAIRPPPAAVQVAYHCIRTWLANDTAETRAHARSAFKMAVAASRRAPELAERAVVRAVVSRIASEVGGTADSVAYLIWSDLLGRGGLRVVRH